MLLVVLLYALFASVFVIAKTGLQYVDPFFFVGIRMVIAGVLLLGYLFLFKRDQLKLKNGGVLQLVLLGTFNIYLTNAFEFWGLQYLTAAKTCFIYSLSPFMSAFLSYLVFSESLTPKKWLGLGVGIVGFIPILLQQGADEVQTGHVAFLSWAEISVLIAALSTVYGWILMRQLVTERQVSPVVANAWSMLVGGIMALINSAAVETWDPFPYTEFWPFFDSMLLMIAVSNLICYNLYGHLLKRFTATFLAFSGFMTPLFTALFGWFFLNEAISGAFVISVTLVLSGLVLFYQEELRKDGIHKAEPASVPN